MTYTAQPATAGDPRKPTRRSPLRVATMEPLGIVRTAGVATAADEAAGARHDLSWSQLRQMMISEFAEWLRTQTNKHKRPFQEGTVANYAEAAHVLGRWMTAQDVDGDFTACDTNMLNRFFNGYRRDHTQGGTNTRQRNLHHLFKWLDKVYDHPDPWTADLVRYGPGEVEPSTLDKAFIRDLLKVTGDGKAKDFEDIRDHAIILVLTEGVRRTEVAQIELDDLSADLLAQPFVRVVPLKGARASEKGRLVPLSLSTARAVAVYLRVRRSHRRADSPALWLGSRNRGPLSGSAIYQMLRRRADQAGWDPDVHPHQFRHTFANDWLDAGGSEGDLMRLMGWKDRSMVDRYAEDMQVRRAIAAKRRMGEMY